MAEAEKLLSNVARRTVQRDLKRLADLGLVSEVGRGATDPNRSYRWSSPTFPLGVVSPHTGSWKRSETAAREHRPLRAAKGTAPSVFAFSLAEEKGFEPLVTCATAVFKAAPKGH